MTIIITDSGFGGLSICAALVQELQLQKVGGVSIKYVNAAPSEAFGYNTMSSKAQKLATFTHILWNMYRCYNPNLIFVACNTLSALLPEIDFKPELPVLVQGIIPLGVEGVQRIPVSQNPEVLLVFATETTITARIYEIALVEKNVTLPIISEACPGLATMISNDLSGVKVYECILAHVQNALQRVPLSKNCQLLILLGCTHYGYRADLFKKACSELGYPHTTLINPNQYAAKKLTQSLDTEYRLSTTQSEISVEFISPYRLPQTEVDTISSLLSPQAPETVKALQHYTLKPELYDSTCIPQTMTDTVSCWWKNHAIAPEVIHDTVFWSLSLEVEIHNEVDGANLADSVFESLERYQVNDGYVLLQRQRQERWKTPPILQTCQEFFHYELKTKKIEGCAWKSEVAVAWLRNQIFKHASDALKLIAEKQQAAMLNPEKWFFLGLLKIEKPWGYEGWYTGVENRGVCEVKSATGKTELPYALSLFRSAVLKEHAEELILLKTLNPVPDPILGDLYLEIHGKKWEVYVVIEVDSQAWPDGKGVIKAGLNDERMHEYQQRYGDSWKGPFFRDFQQSIEDYHILRNQIDQQLDHAKKIQGLPLQSPVAPDVMKKLLQEIPAPLAEQERQLREKANRFVGECSVEVGDVITFPAYQMHSLQHGIKVIEFQTPHYERMIVMYAQKVLTQNHWDTEKALSLMTPEVYQLPELQLLEHTETRRNERFVDFPDFTTDRITLQPGAQLQEAMDSAYHLLIAVTPGAELQTRQGEKTELCPEESVFLPISMKNYTIRNTSKHPLIYLKAKPKNQGEYHDC
ncbi:hypothetical protein WDW89_06435 [Deltaproteobacteria bacterium TL4]